jgi:DNA-binding transcriptional LysR family regulator
MIMDELASIRNFIVAVEAGSFSAAARRVNTSTSAVARMVKSLEDELGVRLLNRNTRHQSLTEVGRVFYERVRAISNDLTMAKGEAQSRHETATGLLRISLRASAATTLIIPALHLFQQKHPDVKLEISLSDERVDLIANNIDVAVWLGDLPDSELVARRLSKSYRVICGSPEYLEKHGTPVCPQDLLKHNCIVYTAPRYGNCWYFSKNGLSEQLQVMGNLRTDSSLILLSAAQAGLGLVVVQEWTVRRPIEEGKLVRVLEDYVVNPIEREAALHVVYVSSRGNPRKIQAFVGFLVDLFRRPPINPTEPAG